jgi:NAD(P)-dependent dehydrogenase (short-subunit alcohol dehydrogenase family)
MNPTLEVEPFIQFQGRRIVVSGASSGIGRAIAIELSKRGAQIILLGRDVDRLNESLGQLHGTGHVTLALDLRDPAQILSSLSGLVAQGGKLYGLCHSAGVVETIPLNALRLDKFREMFEVNVTSGLELARVITRRDLLREDGGSLLFISSVYGMAGMAGQIGYSATKGAVSAAVRSMAVELARRKIRVNSISPALVHTRLSDAALQRLDPARVQHLESLHPLGPGTPEDVARAAAFLLAPETRWITGTDLVIDGGYTAQ